MLFHIINPCAACAVFSGAFASFVMHVELLHDTVITIPVERNQDVGKFSSDDDPLHYDYGEACALPFTDNLYATLSGVRR